MPNGEEFDWTNFDMINYHQFFKAEANNYCLKHNNQFENELFFENVKHKIPKYGAIFIDEVQDYKIEWLRIIKKYFLAESGEFVLFGDEKQNIYKRGLESNKKVRTNIIGDWKKLNESFRLTSKIANIAIQFQNYFFLNKYELDEIKLVSEDLSNFDNNSKPHFEYHFFPSNDLTEIFKKTFQIIEQLKVHPNDIGILSTNIETVRDLDFLIKNKTNEKTETMCETRETFKLLVEKEYGKRKLEKIRRNKKTHFWMNPGTIKLSTVHSFKGWEIRTLFLIIENYPDKDESLEENISLDELVYTGITRCRNNLIIINIGNTKYDMFFKTISQKW